MQQVQGQTIVITGASGGIGEEAAYQLAAQGAKLCLVARRAAELQRVQATIKAAGGQAWIYPCDLADSADLDRCADAILRDHARIDALVNNAARSIRRSIVDALDRPHDYERTIQLNYLSAVRLTLRLLPRFLAQGRGHVVNISTLSSQIPIPLFSAYLSSKTALESFSRSLLAELGHRGITTTVVYFPMVRTPMSSKTSLYKHMPMMDAARAAGWIVEAVVKRPARVTSTVGTVGAVVMAALPGVATRLTQPFFRRMDKKLKDKLAQE